MLDLSSLALEAQKQGFQLNEIIPDGKIHRFRNGRKNKKNGWYICNQVKLNGKDHHFLTVGDWATNEKITLATKKASNQAEKAELAKEKKRLEDLHKKLEKERKDRAAKAAADIIARAQNVNGHSYIDKKKIRDDDAIKNIYQIGRKMIIPISNFNGEIRSLQYIDDKRKLFLTGSETLGNFHKIEAKTKSTPPKAVLCEGFATGSSIYIALNKTVDVIVTFSAHNLPIVAKNLIPLYGEKNIIAACDDDYLNGKNAGREAGEKCKKLGIQVVFPKITEKMKEAKATDFNDLYNIHGPKAVAECFMPAQSKSEYEVEDKPYQQIGFYFRYQRVSENGTVKTIDVPQYKLMADYCFEQKNMCFDDSQSFRFDGKKWVWFTKNALNNFIIEQNQDCIKPAHIDGFSKMIRARCHKDSINPLPTDGLINVNNGIINVKTGELEPHNHRYFFRHCADVDYIKDAECPLWYSFLLEVFNRKLELVDLAQRLFGYIIIGGKPFLHRAFVLWGEGRNGKSTFLDVLRAVVGKNSYSVVSMSKLDKEFSLVNIDGKIANIVEETPTDEINAEVFKTLVGGGEVQAAHKGFDEYTFRCNARFVFACNEMPIFKDKSVGLEDRLVFIPFERYFKEEERDPKMTEKLLAELPGILNWAIEGARMILKDNSLPQYETTKQIKDQYRLQTNPLYAWFCENVEVTTDAAEVTIKEIYDRYRMDLEDSGNKPYSKDKFAKQFKKLVRERCEEIHIEFCENLRDSSGNHRIYNVVRIKNLNASVLTAPKFFQSDKKMSGYAYLDTSD